MTPVLVSVDKAGDLKLGSKKCRLYKKDEVVKVAKKYGINTEKKTVKQLCGSIKGKAKNSMNNVPLAKMYPEAAKKRAEKKALNRKAMTTRITTPTMKVVRAVSPVRIPRPTKKAMPLTKDEAIKRISAMKGLNRSAKGKLVNRVKMGTMSPRRVVKVAREISRLNASGYRVDL
tara:strand:- start:2030 stop:2551 length:522 start_codon:yes stop_codon:yes gene_type:complete